MGHAVGTVTIRSLRPEDAEALGAVHVRAWHRAYRGLMSVEYLDRLRPDPRANRWAEMLGGPPRHGGPDSVLR